MEQAIHFETPENVTVSYRMAGLGTRFTAWFLDQLIVFIVAILIFIVLIVIGTAFSSVVKQFMESANAGGGKQDDIVKALMGMGVLCWSLGGFLYFGFCEFRMSGRTMGKKMLKIRVVKANGFSLDAGALFLRTLFRVMDHLPPLWIVPFLSARHQRLGDMVSGTLVVHEEQPALNQLRAKLLERNPADAQFSFDPGLLRRLSDDDTAAIERTVERWYTTTPLERDLRLGVIVQRIVEPVAQRLNMDSPEPSLRLRFLEDLLSAEYRRQYRHLG